MVVVERGHQHHRGIADHGQPRAKAGTHDVGRSTLGERGDGAVGSAAMYAKKSLFGPLPASVHVGSSFDAALKSDPVEPRIEQLDREAPDKPHAKHDGKNHAAHDKDDEHDKHDKHDAQIHIITRAGLRHLREAGKAGRHAAKVLYNNPNAYIVCKPGQQLPHGWKGKATVLFPSYAAFAAAVEKNQIPRGTDAVVYDNEHWDQTPHVEKTHAMKFARLFGELAHSLGMVYIAAPTRKWFAADARFADIIDIQLQSRESHTRSYDRAIRHDVKLAHRLNPDIKVIGQISSNVNHLDPDNTGNIAGGIHKAERDVVHNAPYLDGFWGYLYQQNHASVKAGQKILKDLAKKEEKGVKI
jgi:hypothetical protein